MNLEFKTNPCDREISPNSIWQHYKGDYYTIIDIVIDASNENNSGKLVIYQSLLDGRTFARPVNEFLGVKDKVTNSCRFIKCENSCRFIKCETPKITKHRVFDMSVTLPAEGLE